jgi:hypothetical protein
MLRLLRVCLPFGRDRSLLEGMKHLVRPAFRRAAETLALLLICHPLICSRLEMVSVRAVAAAHHVLRHVPALLYDVGLEMIWRKQ